MLRRNLMISAGAALLLPSSAVAQPAVDLAAVRAAIARGELPTVDQLLRGLEHNLNAETRTAKITMIVVNPRRTRTMELVSFGRGLDEAAMEFVAPAREKGTKMYRKGDEMWLYLPSVERTQKISGHMLRQGMMGSDMSYEDMSGNTDWNEEYEGVVRGKSDVGGRPHLEVVLTAKRPDITYQKRVTFIDEQTLVPTRQELYAISGMLVKTWEMSDVRQIDGRSYPMAMRIEDKLKNGTYTEIKTTELEFGVDLPTEVFSLRWLERG